MLIIWALIIWGLMIIQATVNWAFSKLNFKSQAPRLDLKGLSVNELSDVWDIYKWASQVIYNISCTDSVLAGNLFVHHFTVMREEKVSEWPCKTMLDVLSKIFGYHGKSLLEWKTTTAQFSTQIKLGFHDFSHKAKKGRSRSTHF